MNLFKTDCSVSQIVNVQGMAIKASRIYVILLMTSLFIVLLFNTLNVTNTVVTIESPSLDTFEQLYAKYPTVLSCPCKTIAVTYGTFLSISVSYHQVSYATNEIDKAHLSQRIIEVFRRIHVHS